MDDVNKILRDRPSKHGEFAENSRATQEILRVLQKERNWPTLNDQQRHALYMTAHKMARIICGNPDEVEHWDDIAGYAVCVANRLREPVIPYNGDDIYSALAVGWNMSRDDAMERVQQQLRQRQEEGGPPADLPGRARVSKLPGGLPRSAAGPEPDRPGTPADGGHHAAASDEIERAADELRREIYKEG